MKDRIINISDTVQIHIGDQASELVFRMERVEERFTIDQILAEILEENSSSIDLSSLLCILSCNDSWILNSNLDKQLLGEHGTILSQLIKSQLLASNLPIYKEKSTNTKQENLFENLPNELFLSLINYLSMSDLGNAMLVCKNWQSFLSSDVVWKTRVSIFDNINTAVVSDDSSLHHQFLKSSITRNFFPTLSSSSHFLQSQPLPKATFNKLLKAAIDGDLHSLFTNFSQAFYESGDLIEAAKNFRGYEHLRILEQFLVWLKEDTQGKCIFYALCIFKQQPILDLLYKVDENIILNYFRNTPAALGMKEEKYKTQDKLILFLVKYNELDKLKIFLQLRGEMDTTFLLNLINIAAEWNHINILKFLLAEYPKKRNSFPSSTAVPMPLCTAAQRGHDDVLKLLLENGFQRQINQNRQRSGTALQLAVGEGHLSIVKLLIEKKANFTTTYSNGSVLLQEAMNNNHYDVFAYLLKNGAANLNPMYLIIMLFAAANKEDQRYAQDLAKRVVAGHYFDHESNTPLHDAVKSGNILVVKLLISEKANLNLKNMKGESPLDCIKYIKEKPIKNEMLQVVELGILAQRGATKEKKIAALCKFYKENNKISALFKSPEKNFCDQMLTLINNNELTRESYEIWLINCQWGVKKPSKDFTIMLNKVKEVLDAEMPSRDKDLAMTGFPEWGMDEGEGKGKEEEKEYEKEEPEDRSHKSRFAG